MFIETLLLVGAVQAVFLALVLTFKSDKRFADKWLIAWLLFIGIHLTFVYFGFSGIYRKYPLLVIWGSALMLLQGPFLYLYTAISTNKINVLQWGHLLHAIPYLLFTGYLGSLLLNVDVTSRYQYLSDTIQGEENMIMLSLGFLNHVHIIIYLVLSILLLRKHSKNLQDSYSYEEGINLKWLKNLLMGIATIAVIILIGLLISDLIPIISHYFKAILIYSALAILPFYMSFYAIRQKLTYPVTQEFLHSKYEASKLTPSESKTIAERLSEHMKLAKPYLDSRLSLKKLSEDLEVYPKDLSQVINENFKKNFFNYVNAYRVEEFKNRVLDPKNDTYTLIAIAYDCGFNTKSAFYRIFRQSTGMTPSAYKESLYRPIVK